MALTILLVVFGAVTLAQGVTGRLLNDRKKPAIAVRVWVNDGEKQVGAALTDSEGYYQIEPLAPKVYEVFAFAAGYDTLHIEGIIVPDSGYTCVNYHLRLKGDWKKEIQIGGKILVISCSLGRSFLEEERRFLRCPMINLSDFCSSLPGVYQARRGDDISIGGSRTSGVGYTIDGLPLMTSQPEHHQVNVR